jgi:histidine ammonia-lyase
MSDEPTLPIPVDGASLTLERVAAVARGDARVFIDKDTRERLAKSRREVERRLSSGSPVYGVTTGYGSLADVLVADDRIQALQVNLVRSHAAGVGPYLPDDVVRAAVLLRANSLTVGASGVRPEIVETFISMLNERLHPAMHSIGSLGASGDLAPLAELALCVIGEGELLGENGTEPSRVAFERHGLPVYDLEAKEGLALLNGTAVSAAVGILALLDAERLVSTAEVIAATTAEALLARTDAFDEKITSVRPHPGAIRTAANLRRIMRGSTLADSDSANVQDAYSVRCLPQILGATRDAIGYVRSALAIEINSVTDNPLFVNDAIISAGNFHGAPIALPLDLLATALTQIGIGSERRCYRLLDPALSRGLPSMLADDPGVESGLMIAQYTAAALVRDLKEYAQPSSADSIPTSAGQEDHVPFALHSALSARSAVEAAERVVGIESVCATRALDLRERSTDGAPSPVARAVRETLRTRVAPHDGDRVLTRDLQAAHELVSSGALLDAARKAMTD